MANAKSPLVVMGSSSNLIYQSFTENGDYEASDYGADGFAGVVVDVPPTLFRKMADRSITTVTAEDLYGVTEIGETAFRKCLSLTSVTLAETVGTIGENAFEYCSNLSTMNFPEGVTTILAYGVFECPLLQEVILPSSISNIYRRSFEAAGAYVSSGFKVVIKATAVPFLESSDAFSRQPAGSYIYVPTPEDYKSDTNWSALSSRIAPLVDTLSDLYDIDTSVYTHACVATLDVGVYYKQFIYDGSSWNATGD